MFETMYEANGIGLAATQVDIHKRLLVLDTPRKEIIHKYLLILLLRSSNLTYLNMMKVASQFPGFMNNISSQENKS